MTDLTTFLTSLYDAVSEAEMQALQHGQLRLAELLESGAVPDDVAVPVYHATDLAVTLDVGLRAEATEDGTRLSVTEATEDATTLAFTVDAFDLLDRRDLEGIDVVDGADGDPRENDRDDEAGERGETGKGDRDDEAGERDEKENSEERDEEATDGTRADDRGRETSADPAPGDASIRVSPVDVLDGIDATYRARLEAAGIGSLADLVERSPEEVAAAIGDEGEAVSPDRAAEWLEEARGLAAVLSEHGGRLPVELVDGIGPTYGNRLRDHGVADLSALAALSPETLADVVSTETTTVAPARAADWLEEAGSTLRALERRPADVGAADDDGEATRDENEATRDDTDQDR